MAAEVVAFTLLGAALVAWALDRYQEHQRRIRECVAGGGHYFERISAWNAGQHWVCNCTRCPYQEPAPPPEEDK